MRFPLSKIIFALVLLGFVRATGRGATDPEIDRLLKKLPPPEKLVHADERIGKTNDPALRDPLAEQIAAALKSEKVKRALELSRQLAARYPSSAAANYLVGECAINQKRYAEASAALQRAIALEPGFASIHFDLAFVEWELRHFDVAMKHLRLVTKLEPKAAAGWAALSVCAEMMGRRDESLKAAKRLVELLPKKSATWERLAAAEKNVGNREAAARAMNQAAILKRSEKAADKQRTAPAKQRKP